MASEQNMTQAITQAAIEDTKAAIMAVREAEDPVNSRRPVYIAPRAHLVGRCKVSIVNKFKIVIQNVFMMKQV